MAWKGNYNPGSYYGKKGPSDHVLDAENIRAETYSYQDTIVNHMRNIALTLPRYITTGKGMEAFETIAVYFSMVAFDAMLSPLSEVRPLLKKYFSLMTLK